MRVVGDFVKLSGEKQHRNTSADLKSARFSSGLFFSLLPGRRALYLKIPALSGHAQKSLQQYAHKETNPACAPHQSRPGKIASGNKAPLLTFGPVYVPRPQPRHHERHGKIRADQNQQNSEVSEASGNSSRGLRRQRQNSRPLQKTRSADRSSLPLPSGCCFVDCLTIARPLRLPFLRGSFYPAQVIFFPCILCTKAPPLRLAFLHKSHSFVKNNGDLRKSTHFRRRTAKVTVEATAAGGKS